MSITTEDPGQERKITLLGYLARLINSLGTHRLELAVGLSTAMAIMILYGWSGTRLNLQGGLALGVLGILTAMVMAVLLFEVAIETWRLDRNQPY